MTTLSYELVNPSDRITFKAPSLEVAAQAVVIVGHGKYGATSLDGGEGVPVFLFGGHDAWFRDHCGKTADASLTAMDRTAVAECLESFTLAGERTSLNNICQAAREIAQALRAAAEREPSHG